MKMQLYVIAEIIECVLSLILCLYLNVIKCFIRLINSSSTDSISGRWVVKWILILTCAFHQLWMTPLAFSTFLLWLFHRSYFDIENSRVFVIGNPLTSDFDIVTNGDKEFVFASTPFKSDFISSMIAYLHQCLVDIKRLLTKPLKNMKRSKSVLLKEYEKLKAQCKEQGACEGVMKSNQQEVTTERVNDNIPSNVDFTCYQNVKNRFKALYLLAKLTLGCDKGHRYVVMDRGFWKTLDVYPRQFLWEGYCKWLPECIRIPIWTSSGLVVASKYPIVVAEVDCFPTITHDLRFNESSMMLLKVDLGLKKRKDCDNTDISDQLKKEIDTNERYVGFLTNVSSTHNIDNSSLNDAVRLNNKLENVIENFKRDNLTQNEELGDLNEGISNEHDVRNEVIVFSVVAGRMPVSQKPKDNRLGSSMSSSIDSGLNSPESENSKKASPQVNDDLRVLNELPSGQSFLKNGNSDIKGIQYRSERALSFQEDINRLMATGDNNIIFDTNFMCSGQIDYKLNLDSDGIMNSMPISLKLCKKYLDKDSEPIHKNLKKSSKIGRSKTFHGQSGNIDKKGNITKFCPEKKSASLTSLSNVVSTWNLADAKAEIKKLGVVRAFTNLTEKVSSPDINGYAKGIMNYLTFTEDIRSCSSRRLSNGISIYSPWSLVDNVNHQFDLQATYDDID